MSCRVNTSTGLECVPNIALCNGTVECSSSFDEVICNRAGKYCMHLHLFQWMILMVVL